MKSQVNIAVIGIGYMGRNHIKILSSLPDVNLIAVCDVDQEKTQKIARQYKVRGYTNYTKLLENEKLDAITICMPTPLHYKTATECIKRKLVTFIEKPICETLTEAKKLTKLAKVSHTPMMIGHIERFNPVVNEIKLRIKSGEIGKIIKIHTQRFSPPVMSQNNVSVVIDLATHDIDVMQYLLGEPIVRLYAEGLTKFHKKEDLMSALLRFKSGTIGLLEVSWLHPIKARNLTILGENGMYSANYLTQELQFSRQSSHVYTNTENYFPFTGADVVKVAFQAQEPLYIELRAFINAILFKKRMPVTGEDGLHALEIAERIIKSANTNNIIYK
ncbi:MAG: Oxidoreductase domain protein [Candidatus Curtissbacteria bacterium GW2011_GWA1_40_9]|uniref:Oxidoreductase domain protein n=1 Tax=Candidatus Curtissbacteria bacterium GW2011_GWA1_40_9 TaxID=1618408 RepID=A0A0G0TTZ2_9BACT|nr:MAG: Oxidoreductase domain protein [Candidatus Curtissbacteria bacterium GW2011_GWA1_40_9]